jgi:hypothetical protein
MCLTLWRCCRYWASRPTNSASGNCTSSGVASGNHS